MATLIENAQIRVTGMPSAMEFGDGVLTIEKKVGATATAVTVTWTSLGLAPALYNFDNQGLIIIPTGDIVRAMVAGGTYGAGVTLCEVKDNTTNTPMSVVISILRGDGGILNDRFVTPRNMYLYANGRYNAFCFNPLTTTTADWERSTDGGATWTTAEAGVTSSEGLWRPNVTAVQEGDLWRVNDSGSILWQGRVRPLCELGEMCALIWQDDQRNQRQWCFEVVEVVRQVTETQEVERIRAGEFMPSSFYSVAKNFTYSLKLRVRGLSRDEVGYFDSLITSPEVVAYPNSAVTIPWIALYSGGVQPVCNVTGKTFRRGFGETADITFDVDIIKFKQF